MSATERPRFALPGLYRVMIRTTFLNGIQYRVPWLVELTLMLAEPVVFLVVWRLVAEAEGGSVDGYTAARFAGYYVVWGAVRTMTQSGNPANWEAHVREGRLSAWLLRPVHPVHQDVALWLGFAFIRILMWIPGGIAMIVIFRPEIGATALTIAAFPLTVVVAAVVRSLNNTLVGSLAFWTTSVQGVTRLVSAFELLLSGRLVPVAILPGWATTIAEHSPFYAAFGFPIDVLVGPMSAGELGRGVVIQLFWLVLIVACVRRSFGAGIKRFGAVGG